MSFYLNSKNGQHGASLIETMVALFVMAIGMLGVINLQAKSNKFNQSAYYYTQAVYLAGDIAERIRMNTQEVAQYDNTIPSSVGIQCDQSQCTDAQMRDWHLWAWEQRVQNALPAGKAQISVDPIAGTSSHVVEIVVSFDDAKTDAANMESKAAANALAVVRQEYSLLMEI